MMASTITIEWQWQLVNFETYSCRKCRSLFFEGGEALQLVVYIPEVDKASCTVSGVILCKKCYGNL